MVMSVHRTSRRESAPSLHVCSFVDFPSIFHKRKDELFKIIIMENSYKSENNIIPIFV